MKRPVDFGGIKAVAALSLALAAHSLSEAKAAPAALILSEGGYLYLPCSVESMRGWCLLDSLSPESVVLRRAVRGLPRGWRLVRGSSGGLPVLRLYYEVRHFESLGKPLGPGKVATAGTFAHPGRPEEILGVLGRDAFRGGNLWVDPLSRQAEIVERVEAPLRCTRLASMGAPLIEAQTASGNALNAAIDTASAVSLLHPRLRGQTRPLREKEVLADVDGGVIPAERAELELRLLGLQTTLKVALPSGGVGLERVEDPGVDLLLGLDFLLQRPFVLDYSKKRFCVAR